MEQVQALTKQAVSHQEELPPQPESLWGLEDKRTAEWHWVDLLVAIRRDVGAFVWGKRSNGSVPKGTDMCGRQRSLGKRQQTIRRWSRDRNEKQTAKRSSNGKSAAQNSMATAESVNSTVRSLKRAGRHVKQTHRERSRKHGQAKSSTVRFDAISDDVESDWTEVARVRRSGRNRQV